MQRNILCWICYCEMQEISVETGHMAGSQDNVPWAYTGIMHPLPPSPTSALCEVGRAWSLTSHLSNINGRVDNIIGGVSEGYQELNKTLRFCGLPYLTKMYESIRMQQCEMSLQNVVYSISELDFSFLSFDRDAQTASAKITRGMKARKNGKKERKCPLFAHGNRI